MKTRRFFAAAVIASFLMIASASYGQVPPVINYQGQVTDASGKPANGNFTMVFSIFDAVTGGTALYTETQNVTVSNGVFNALIGSVIPIPQTLFDGSPIRLLEITVNGTVLTPRRPFGSVPYAFTSRGGGSSSPWQISGNNVYYNNGNVGIGRNNPGVFAGASRYLTLSASEQYLANQTAALELQGSSIDANIPVARIDFSSVAPSFVSNNIARIHAAGGTSALNGKLVFFTHNGTSLNEAMRINHNGNIGIGTSTPGQKLDVVGTVFATAFVGDGSGLTNLPAGPWQTSGNNIYYQNGRVGVGTTNPTALVHSQSSGSIPSFLAGGSSADFAVLDNNQAMQFGKWDGSSVFT